MLIALACFSATAQVFQPRTIQFKGDSHYTDAELAVAADLKKGVSFTSAQMDEHSKLLMDTGLFQNIAYTFNGQDLVFQLVPASPLYSLRLENFPPGILDGIDQRLRDKLPLYRGRVPSTGGILDSIQKELLAELAAQGIKASLAVGPYSDMTLGRVTAMSITITEPDIETGEIQIAGASSDFADKVRVEAGKVTGTPYSSESSGSQLESRIADVYGSAGYIEVRARATALPQVKLTSGTVRIPFTVQVQEGRQFKLTGVQVSPDTILTQADFDKVAGLHPGDIASLAKLRGCAQLIVRLYHNRGFMKASVQEIPTTNESQATVSYLITANPGHIYNTGRIRVRNAPDDVRELILSALKLPPDAPFNESAIRSLTATHGNPAVARLFSTYNLSYSLALHDETHTVDVEISMEPKHSS